MVTYDPVNADIDPVDDVASDLAVAHIPSILIFVGGSLIMCMDYALVMNDSHSIAMRISLHLWENL